jgi:hypothetical protein
MKSIFAFLFLCRTAFAQFEHPNDFRMIGTNVYDFTYAGSPAHPSGYLLSGTITRIYPKSVEVSIPSGTVFIPDVDSIRKSMFEDGPGGQLQALSALRLGQRPMALGEFMALSPEMRANFKEVETYKQVYILDLSKDVQDHNLTVGANIQTLAVPTTIPDFWDHGIKLTNVPTSGFFRIFPDRITRISTTATNLLKP